MRTSSVIFCCLTLFFFSCKKKSINCDLDCGEQTEELLFQTGFSGTSITNGEYKNALFSGADLTYTEKNDWSNFSNHQKIGYVEIGYEDGDDAQRQASITGDNCKPTLFLIESKKAF